MSWIKKFIFVTVVAISSFEGLSFLITKFGIFLVNETPSLYISEDTRDYQDIIYGRTERDKWGAWHVSNSTFRHRKSCFNVTMTFNEVGARDDSFQNIPASALILLGDSFAEGFGVAREDMSEYLIEKEVGIPILNFGTSGSFGPLQELLIYEEFKHLPHRGLIVYILPSNDFTDNDLEFWKAKDQSRYRPYFSAEGNPLVPYYFPTAIPRDNFFSTSVRGRVKQFIKDHFWASNAIRTVLMLMREDEAYSVKKDNSISSFYYDATIQQQSNLVLAYEAILNAADNRDVLFVVIPSTYDIARNKYERVPNSYKNTHWYESFIDFQKRTEQRVEILDLMEHLPETTEEYYFVCDGHWSMQGNAWAATVVSDFIKTKMDILTVGNRALFEEQHDEEVKEN